MRTRAPIVAVVAIVACLLGVIGCGAVASGPPADAGDRRGETSVDSGKACSSDTDCEPNQVCAYLESAGCAAHGACVARAYDGGNPPGGCILAYSCGCDGGTIDYNVSCAPGVSGYVSTPILHPGACGSDGG